MVLEQNLEGHQNNEYVQIGIETIYTNILQCILKIWRKPIVSYSSNAIVIWFSDENVMIYCFKSFLEINKYSTIKISIIIYHAKKTRTTNKKTNEWLTIKTLVQQTDRTDNGKQIHTTTFDFQKRLHAKH